MATFDQEFMEFIRNFDAFPDYQLMSSKHAAFLIGIEESTLRKWRMTNDGPPYVNQNGTQKVFYRVGDVRDYLKQLPSFKSSNTQQALSSAPGIHIHKIKAFSHAGANGEVGEMDYGDELPFARVNGELKPFFSTLEDEIDEIVWMTEYAYMEHKFLDGHDDD